MKKAAALVLVLALLFSCASARTVAVGGGAENPDALSLLLGRAYVAETRRGEESSTHGRIVSEEYAAMLAEPDDVPARQDGAVDPAEALEAVDTIDLNIINRDSISSYAESLMSLGCNNRDRANFSAKVLNLWDYAYNGDLDTYANFRQFLPYKDVIRYAIDGQNREVFYDREGKPLFWLSNFDFDSRLRENLSAAVTWLEENEATDALDKLAANGGCLLFAALTQPDKDENAVWMNKWGQISFNIGPETSGALDDQEIRDVFIRGLLAAAVTSFDKSTYVMELKTEDSPEAALSSYKTLAETIDWENFKLAPIVITQEYKDHVVDEIWDYQKSEPAPIPTEEVKTILEAWKEETFGPYRQELKDLGAEDKDRINFGARMLYAWDNSKDMKGTDRLDKFQNYLSREEIIDFVLTGENEDIFCDENGKPMVWQIIADKKAEPRVKRAFKASLDWYADNGAPDALESMCNNGFCILFAAVSDPERGPGFILTEHGIISPNMDSENIKILKDKGLRNILNMGLMVESYGIAYLQIVKALGLSGFSLVGNGEVVKSLMAAYVAESMAGVYKEYVIYSEEFFGKAENFANNFSLSLDDPWIPRQLELMADLIDPIGFASLREAKAFNEAIGAKAAETPAAIPYKELKKGDRGDEVKRMQRELIRLGYLDGKADGVFGEQTAQAVLRFKKANGIQPENSNATPETLARLYGGEAVAP